MIDEAKREYKINVGITRYSAFGFSRPKTKDGQVRPETNLKMESSTGFDHPE